MYNAVYTQAMDGVGLSGILETDLDIYVVIMFMAWHGKLRVKIWRTFEREI
jgi:hypothetical protein